MTDTDAFNTIYLDLEIRKSKGKVDNFGKTQIQKQLMQLKHHKHQKRIQTYRKP